MSCTSHDGLSEHNKERGVVTLELIPSQSCRSAQEKSRSVQRIPMGQKKNYRIIEIEKKYIKEIEMEYIEETMMMAEGRDHRGWKYKNSAKVHRLSSRRLFYVVARV